MSNDYPAFRFGPNGSSVVILSPEDDSMLPAGWSDKAPADFDPKGHPTYGSFDTVPRPVLVEKIAEELEAKFQAEKRKPGRPKKAE